MEYEAAQAHEHVTHELDRLTREVQQLRARVKERESAVQQMGEGADKERAKGALFQLRAELAYKEAEVGQGLRGVTVCSSIPCM